MSPANGRPAVFAGKNILITGGLGFIGSNLAIRLARSGAVVTVVDSLIPEFGGLIHNVEPVEKLVKINISDLRDAISLRTLVQGQDYIFHLAGQVSHGDSMRDPERDLAVNCVSTIKLLEACRINNPGCRLIYTSTRQVYGIVSELPACESLPTLPIDVNGINKLAAEYYHLLYHRTYGLRSVVLRLTNTYGPRQQIRNNRQGFVSIFIRQALKGELIQVYGTGHQVRDFNYVDDVVDALLLAGSTEDCYGNVFNLGAPTHHSILEFIETLNQIIEVDFEIVPFPDKKAIIDIGDFYADFSQFRNLTNWVPGVDLKNGLEQTIRFYEQNRNHYF